MNTINEKHKPYAWVIKSFRDTIAADPEMSAGVAAVRALREVIKASKASTMMQLEMELKLSAELLQSCPVALSVSSACELFTRMVTVTSIDVPDFIECKAKLLELGEKYIKQAAKSRDKIAQLADSFIRDGVTVLTYGFSRVVINVLLKAAAGKRFSVLVCEARTDDIGYTTAKRLQDAGIPVTVIMDNAVAYFMETVDLVLLGAEGIVENGGVINKVGSYQISIVAHEFKKPLYIAAESFKFMRLYPLNQRDLPASKVQSTKFKFCKECSPEDHEYLTNNIKVLVPSNDYTPPGYITLLFTELGILTPAALFRSIIEFD
jgi:translation initiation factor eIF-2B subunit alpha